MIRDRLFGLVVALAAVALQAGCYDPPLVDGAQKCAAGGKCPEGMKCFPDNRCHKPDANPTCSPACSGGKVCDPATLACVDCLADKDCPDGSICKGQACVAGCNAGHPGCGCHAGWSNIAEPAVSMSILPMIHITRRTCGTISVWAINRCMSVVYAPNWSMMTVVLRLLICMQRQLWRPC